MRFKKIYFLISALVLMPGILSLLFFGLKPSIDFTGGTLWEVKVISDKGEVISEDIEKVFAERELEIASIQPSGENQFIIRTVPLSTEQHDQILSALKEKFGDRVKSDEENPSGLDPSTRRVEESADHAAGIEEIRFETLGPTLGRELLFKALLAIGLAALAILAYVAYRFKNLMYGVSAILAMFHDTFVLLGTFSLLGHFWGVEVGTLFVTAALATLSFSVHDTIVVFDRIREILRRNPSLSAPGGLETAVNQAVGETLVRSINNSLTIVFMLLALLLLGGETLRWFVFALLVGTISGTYSSTFTAAPLLVVWWNLPRRRSRKS